MVKEDALENHLTPFEVLENQAKLRLSYLTPKERMERIKQAIGIMRLNRIANTKINDLAQIYGTSVELQLRRRIMIATEMVRDCAILVLEDPLCGMQYEQMVDVVCALKEVCKTGKMVILTVEQPPLDIVKQFDKILLLHEGQELYLGRPDDMRDFFGQHQIAIPEISDPVDYLINILNMSDETFESVEKNLGTSEIGVYSKKTYSRLLKVIRENQDRDILYGADEN